MAAQGLRLKSLIDVLAVVDGARDFSAGEVWWRGQGDKAWPLTPGAHRPRADLFRERTMVARFQQKACSRHADCPPFGHHAQWLFLMQHYGLPTRLLDWSESPLVATYFAVSSQPSADGALWMLDPYGLNGAQVQLDAILNVGDAPCATLFDAPFTSPYDAGDADSTRVVALEPQEIDARMRSQLAAFTLHGPLAAIGRRKPDRAYLRRHVIPAGAKLHLLRELARVGIHRRGLFPDLQNLAADIQADPYRMS